MLFHLFANSIFATFASFIIGYLCWMGALNNMETVCFLGGIFFLMLTYATLGLALVFYYMKQIHAHARVYFCKTATLERKVLANRIKQNTLSMQSRLERQQLHYRSDHERQRLSEINHKKHLRQLAKDIQQQLTLLRNRIPEHTFQLLKNSLRDYYRSGNVEELVALHWEIQSIR